MIQKEVASLGEAVADIDDGATVMIGGFGTAGLPNELVGALLEQGATDLTVVNNNAGNGEGGLAALIAAGRVRRVVCSFPRQADSHHFDRLYRAGKIELELVPQGNLAERIRAAGAGIGGFFTPPGPASAASSRRRATAPSSPVARRRARSTAACTCSRRRCMPTTPSSRRSAAIAGATSSTG
jgi:3-oxoacid CoA-transferase A subunit